MHQTHSANGSVPVTSTSSTSAWAYTTEVSSLGISIGQVASIKLDVAKEIDIDNVVPENYVNNTMWVGILSGTTWYFSTDGNLLDETYLRGDPRTWKTYIFELTNLVEIPQAYFGSIAEGWAVDRTPSGPASNLGDSTNIDGIAFLFERHISMIGNQRMDNIVIEGIPEPSALALLGFGGAALLLISRRRR